MKIVKAIHDLHVGPVFFRADTNYVCSDNAAAGVAHASRGMIKIVANAAPYTRHWQGEDGTSLLIYRCLGLGDEFMAARLAVEAKHRCPDFNVSLAIFDAHHALWQHTQAPFNFLGAFIPFKTWQAFDYHVAGENWWESNSMLDQPDAWSMMCNATGFNIPSESRIPYIPHPSDEAMSAAADLIGVACRTVLWQIGASSPIRSYPPENTLKAINRLLEANIADQVIACGHPMQFAEYDLPANPRVKRWFGGIPGLIALAKQCADMNLTGAVKACVVCPDSVLGHIAATFPALPVVSLWSSFRSEDRVGTYPNHHPIYNPIPCSPCRAHEASGNPDDYKGCPATRCRDYCAGLRTIAPERITKAVREVMP